MCDSQINNECKTLNMSHSLYFLIHFLVSSAFNGCKKGVNEIVSLHTEKWKARLELN